LKYTKYPDPDWLESVNYAKKKPPVKATDQCSSDNEIENITLQANKFELFICESKQLFSRRDFSDVHKRNMILPFAIHFTRKTHKVPNKECTKFITTIRNQCVIEELIIRLSYQDYLLLNNSINFQLEQIKGQTPSEKEKPTEEKVSPGNVPKKTEVEEECKEDKESLNVLSTASESSIDNWTDNLQEYSLISNGLQIVSEMLLN